MFRCFDGQIVFLGVVDRDVAGECEIADRGDAVHVRCHRGNRHLETHLIVALARASVRDGCRAELARSLDQVLDDHRARQRRHERVLPLVEGVGLEGGHAVLGCELVARIGNVGFDRAAIEGTLANHLEVLTALADVDGDGHNLAAGLFADPSDRDRGVQSS